jgi:lantibiotic leader peptide-processing serine protease
MGTNITRRSLLAGAGAAGATLLCTGFATASDGQARYLVRTKGGDAEVDDAFEVLNELAGGRVTLLKGPADGLDRLRDADGVQQAVQDFELEIEEPVAEATAEDEDAPTIPDDPDDVYDELLWDKRIQQVREAQEYATGAGRTVAIVDTGVEDTHPDLDVDTEQSVAVIDGQLEDHTGDTGDHGTHVAGTVAATGDALMTGTAPDATLVSVRVIGGGSGAFGDIMVGMAYAAEIGADAANISLGFMAPPNDPDVDVGMYRQLFEPVANAAQREGTLLVGSGGNDETDLRGGWLRLWNGLAGTIGVSATTPDDELAFYSNYGTNDIEVGAPGGGRATEDETETEDLVFSTEPVDDGGYGWKAGTSMAAPQVAGLAALVRELDPDANPQQVTNAIQQAADGPNGRGDPELGAGRTNALSTVERLQ